jgi:hypothetical protein
VAPTAEAARQALRDAETSVPAGSLQVNVPEGGVVVVVVEVVVVVDGVVVVVLAGGGTVVGAALSDDDDVDPEPGWVVVVGGLTVGGASLAGAGANVVRPVSTTRPAVEGGEPAVGPAAVVANPTADAATAMTIAALRPKRGHAPIRW